MRETSIRQRDMVLATAERVAGLGYALWDERTRSYVFVSEQYANFFGVSPDEYFDRYQTYEAEAVWIHPDDLERYESHYNDYLRNPRECSVEVRYRLPEQAIRYTRQFLAPIFGDSGRLTQTVIIDLDISELKNTRQRSVRPRRWRLWVN